MTVPAGDPDVGTVRALLAEQFPSLAREDVRRLTTSGTENEAFRVGNFLLRLPRDDDAEAGLAKEVQWLPRLTGAIPLELPEIAHMGTPTEVFPRTWTIHRWIEGEDASRRVLAGEVPGRWADQLAELVRAFGRFDLGAVPLSQWPVGGRGGPLSDRVDALATMDDPLAGRPDPSPVAGVIEAALAARPDPVDPVLLHADLIPGNLVVRGDRLVGLIDLGTLTTGVPAWDLTPAWWVLDRPGRARFRPALGADDASWSWGRALAATQGLLAQWFYAPRHHPLAALGARAVQECLADG